MESALGASHLVLRVGVFPRRRVGKSEKFIQTPVVVPYPLSPAWTLRTKAHERRKVTGWMVMVMSEQTISPALVPRERIFSFCIYERELGKARPPHSPGIQLLTPARRGGRPASGSGVQPRHPPGPRLRADFGEGDCAPLFTPANQACPVPSSQSCVTPAFYPARLSAHPRVPITSPAPLFWGGW